MIEKEPYRAQAQPGQVFNFEFGLHNVNSVEQAFERCWALQPLKRGLISRPRQSQGLLYKQPRDSLSQWVSKSAFSSQTQLYGCSIQCSRPVLARHSMGFGPNPLINGLIQHAFKLNILFLEKNSHYKFVNNLKIFSNVVFDSSNWAFWDTERNAKNRSPLQSIVLEKIKKNYQKLAVFNKKSIFDYF